MEWLLVSPQIHSAFGSLGSLQGDVYRVGDDCRDVLDEIYKKLTEEDRNLRTFRRAIGFGQNVKRDLVPILIHVKDDDIVDSIVRILVNLTIPVECLLSVEDMSKTNVGQHTIFELNNLLIPSKELFADGRVTKSILDYVNRAFDKGTKLTAVHLENVNNALLLLRNVLHIPEIGDGSGQCSLQNQILWNLFTQSVDRTLLFLISSPYGSYWSVTVVQLIALIYKDQHVGNLQKLLDVWFEASLSETSEDNESNTSPPDRGSDDSSPAITSDPTSDSSDNGGSGNGNGNDTNAGPGEMDTVDSKNPEAIAGNSAVITYRLNGKRAPPTPLSHLSCSGPNTGPKKGCVSSNSEFSDCGYVTQMENRESISTSSNEEDNVQQKHFHQKHHGQKQRINAKKRPFVTVQERKEKRRKKLVERGRTSIINMKGLMHHVPTDDDISNVLKEFTVDFLLKGYGNLVHVLHSQLLYNTHLQIDTSHFYWLLTYFLKFAAQLELDLEFVHRVLSFDIISYLTYEGVNLCEQVQLISKFNSSDLKSCLRRIHLVVSAIREFIQTIEIYKKIPHLSDEDRVQLVKLQIRIGSTEDLRSLFVLLLRHYQSEVYSKQYLQDLIVTNHALLLFLDNAMNRPDRSESFLVEHLQQFATVEVMHQYGLMLQDYKTNGEYVNDCIFTMMHHVGGDLDRMSTLFQPIILKVFLAIWESDFEICDDWKDLIDYVINTFTKNPRSPPKCTGEDNEMQDSYEDEQYAPLTFCNSDKADSWTEEEIESLNWNYIRSAKKPNLVENICAIYHEDGYYKSYNSVVKQLFKQGIIPEDEYRKLLICSGSKKELQEYFNCTLPSKVPNTRDEIEVLKMELEKQNMGKALLWIQKVLLEMCFIKICFNNHKSLNENIDMNQIIPTMESVVFHNILQNQPVPVVPWSNEQSTAIHNQTFLILLHRLGFVLPMDSGKLFLRIPHFWDADALFVVASKLGPVDESALKFSMKQINSVPAAVEPMETTDSKNDDDVVCIRHVHRISSVVRVSGTAPPLITIKETKISTIEENNCNWLDVIMKNKASSKQKSKDEKTKEETKVEGENIMGPPKLPPPTQQKQTTPKTIF